MRGKGGIAFLKEGIWEIRRKIAFRLILGLLGEKGRNNSTQNGPSSPAIRPSTIHEGVPPLINRKEEIKNSQVSDGRSRLGSLSVRVATPILPSDPVRVGVTSVDLLESNRQREIQPASEGYTTVFRQTFMLEFSAHAIFAEIPWDRAMVEFSVKPRSPSPLESYLEVTVRDPCTGRVLAQDGYGYKYSTATRKRIRLPGSGSYHITLYGKRIEATLCLLVTGCEEKPVTERMARTTNTFTLALKRCGLDREIDEGGKYTLFVPTDEAFLRLEEEKPGFLFQISSDKEMLSRILKYHILRGKFRRADLSMNGNHHSLLGPSPPIRKIDDRILVDGAVLSLPEIECGPGIIHLVDRVLIPPGNVGNAAGQSSTVDENDLHNIFYKFIHVDDITKIAILIFFGVITYGALVITFF
jgi:uncharacterized surface protein with fasciclin (FAS1) repeats